MELDEAQQRVALLESEISKAEAKLGQMETEGFKVNEVVSEKDAVIEELRDLLARARRERQETLRESERRSEEFEKNALALDNELQAQKAQHADEIATNGEAILALQEDLRQLQGELSQLQDSKNEQTEALREKEVTLAELREKLDAAEAAKVKEVQALEKQHRATHETLAAQLDARDAELVDLKGLASSTKEDLGKE